MRKIFTLLSGLALCGTLMAQWTSNTLVNTEVSTVNTAECKTFATSDGKTWLVYYRSVPAPNYFEMRAQLLDKNGFRLLGNEGALVNNVAHSSFTNFFAATVDGSDNLIVALVTTTSPNTIYVNKVNTSGAQVWSSSISFVNGNVPRLGLLANNDVIVSWWTLAGTANRALMQRLNAATGAQVWATPISVEPATATHRTTPGHILPLSGNDFIHVFNNRTSAIGTASTLWAQRYNAAGVAQWATPVQLTDKTTAYNREYYPVMDKDTLFLAYYPATGSRTDALVQRVNPDGTRPWGMNGTDFATDNTFYEFEIFIALDPSINSIWATSRLTNTSQGNQGTYLQKFNKTTGARQFTDNSKAIYPMVAIPQVIPSGISLFSDKSPLLLLTRNNSAVSSFLYAAKLDNNGNFVWAGDTVALAKVAKAKSRIMLSSVVNDQAVAGWVETKGTIPQPYAQAIRINGSTGMLAPISSFTANKTTVCRDSTVSFSSTSTGVVESYAWSFPGGNPSASTDPNPSVTYSSNGVYTASLTVANSGGSNTSTQTNYMNVVGIQALAGPAKTIVSGYDVKLDGSVASGAPVSIAWTPNATLTGANTLSPVAKPSVNTIYTLTVADNNNCKSLSSTEVTVLPECIKPMNAFTPNGDGTNDLWLVTTNGGVCLKQVSATVYNRYGNAVYKNDNYQNNWDGKYNGKPVADGTYYYVITYRLINNDVKILKGDLTILR